MEGMRPTMSATMAQQGMPLPLVRVREFPPDVLFYASDVVNSCCILLVICSKKKKKHFI
jgi:hypothetical protein